MANKTIPNLLDYGSQDTDKIKKDLLEITKNDGTYASPSYPTGASRKITVEELKTALAIDASFIKDLVLKFNADTVLEIGKINWVLLNNHHTMSIATPNASNLGKICLVTNRVLPHHSGPGGPYTITITGTTATPLEITGENSIVGLVCVTDGVAYGWEVFSRYNVGDFDLISQTITNGVTDKSPSEDAVFDALALKEPVITKNSLSTPLVWTSANGVASFQPIPVLGDLTYYFTNTASDVATYYKQTTTPQVALTSLPFASVTDGQLLATFISEPSNPNRLSIPDGQYLNHLHLGKTGGTKDLQVRAEIWETTSAGVDIVKLADLGPSSILVGSGSIEYVIGYNTLEKTLSGVTSRIATKLYAVVGVSGSAPSISIFQGDGSDSRSNLPAPVVDATNYVPYDGMLKDLTTGSKDIIISNATASTPTFFDTAKKLISTTAQLWGTWVQTWVPKATPVDLDTIGFYDSNSIFVGVKSTLLNFWTTYLLPKVQALGYLSGTGLTTDRVTKWDGSKLVNSNFGENSLIGNVSAGTRSYIIGKPVGADSPFEFRYFKASGGDYFFIRADGSGMEFYNDVYVYRAADGSNPVYISPKGISGFGYKPMIAVATDSTNNQSTYTAYHTPTNSYTLVSNSSGQLMLFAINDTIGTLINATHNKSSVQQGAWYNGGLLVGSGTKLASAALQVNSTSQGSIPYPRMTNIQRTALTVGPTTYGLMVYCTDATEGLWIYKSTGWTFII